MCSLAEPEVGGIWFHDLFALSVHFNHSGYRLWLITHLQLPHGNKHVIRNDESELPLFYKVGKLHSYDTVE